MRCKIFLSLSSIRMELIRRTGRRVFVHTVPWCLVTAGFHSRHPGRCPRRTPGHRRRHSCWHTSNRTGTISTGLMCCLQMRPWSTSTMVMNRRVRVFRRVVERLEGCSIQERDGTTGHDDWGGRDSPWTHHRRSHATSADSSSFGACPSTCNSGSDDKESVMGIGLVVLNDIQLLLNVLGPCGHRQGVQFVWSAPPWSWSLRENSFASWYGERHCLLLM